MATKGISVYTHQGEDYTINDQNIAGEFSASTAYAKGAYCYYQGNLYRFTSDHAAGAWNSSHVSQVYVGAEIIRKNAETRALIEAADVPHIYEHGTISDDGEDEGDGRSDRVRTNGYINTADVQEILINRSAVAFISTIFYYDSDHNFIEMDRLNSSTSTVKIIDRSHACFRITFIDYSDETWNKPISIETVENNVQFFKGNTNIITAEKDVPAINQVLVGGDSVFVMLEQGNIASDGTDSDNNKDARIRTKGYVSTESADYITVDQTNGPFITYITYYDDNYTLISEIGELTYNGTKHIKILKDYPYFRMVALDYSNSTWNKAFGYRKAQNIYSFAMDSERLREIESSIESIGNAVTRIPTYFESNVAAAKSRVIEHMQTVGKDGASFVFCTDIHWEQNSKNSPGLIARICHETNVNKIFLGGDYITQYASSVENAMTAMRKCIDKYKDLTEYVFPIFGNHDRNSNHYGGSQYYMTKAQTYEIINSWMDLAAKGGNDYFNFYIDDTKNRTRIICLDSGAQIINDGEISAAEIAWMESVVDELSSDWHVIIVIHWLFNPTNGAPPSLENGQYTTYAQNLFTHLDAINAATGKAKVESIIAGHLHFDANDTTTGGIPIVFTDTDSRNTESSEGATEGTIKEQCFDVITIDYTQKKIYCDRVGRGSDRIISY